MKLMKRRCERRLEMLSVRKRKKGEKEEKGQREMRK